MHELAHVAHLRLCASALTSFFFLSCHTVVACFCAHSLPARMLMSSHPHGSSSMKNTIHFQNKTSQETQRSLQVFLEPERKPKVFYTGNSLEFGKACEDLSWNHCRSTPHRSETNGIAERAVRRVKEGSSVYCGNRV